MKEFLKYIRNCHRGRAAVLVLMGTLSALTSVLMNYSLEYAVDFVFRTGNTGLWKAIPLFLFMAAATYLTDQLGENYCVEKCRLVFVKDMREKLIKSYHLLPFEKAREKNRGELMNRDEMTNDAGDLFVSLAYELPYCLLESVGFSCFWEYR